MKNSFKNKSDISKDVPIEDVDVFDDDKEHIMTLKFNTEKTSDLYDKTVYTVVRREHDLSMGIFPQDQGFSDKYVILWHNKRDLLNFDTDKWDVIEIRVPGYREVADVGFYSAVPGVYAVRNIPIDWDMEHTDLFSSR